MTQFAPGLIIEILLIVLLLATVGYCMVLNGRLARLRSSQDDLRLIISELGTATQTAETAIRGLKTTTEEADARLTEKLHKAQLLTRELAVLAEAAPQAVATATPPPSFIQDSPAEPVMRAAATAPKRQEPRVASVVKAEPATPVEPARKQAPPDPEAWRQLAMARLKKAG